MTNLLSKDMWTSNFPAMEKYFISRHWCAIIVANELQPRANIKKLVKEGQLSITDDQSNTSFAKKYIVAKEYVANAVRHIYENTVSVNLYREEMANQTWQRKLKKFGD